MTQWRISLLSAYSEQSDSSALCFSSTLWQTEREYNISTHITSSSFQESSVWQCLFIASPFRTVLATQVQDRSRPLQNASVSMPSLFSRTDRWPSSSFSRCFLELLFRSQTVSPIHSSHTSRRSLNSLRPGVRATQTHLFRSHRYQRHSESFLSRLQWESSVSRRLC